jgi:hypothetical protein
MPGFFEALENFRPSPRKKLTATIEGKTVEVDLDTKKKIIQHGEHMFIWKDGKIVMRQIKRRSLLAYPKLTPADKGYSFYDDDPFWPKEIVEGGYNWKIESE